MEISSLPFLSSEDYYHFFNWEFQEMDDGFNPNKRWRKDDDLGGQFGLLASEESRKSELEDILASLVSLDEEAKRENGQRVIASEQERVQFEANHEQKVRAINEYCNQHHDHYSSLDDLDNSTTPQARKSDLAAAVSATATASRAEGENPGQSGSGSAQQRRVWVKVRSKDWWEWCSHPDFPEKEFQLAFRMSKATFKMICEELEPVIMKKNTMLRDAIPVRQRVAVCIWRLATGEALRLVSKRFGLGISTCHKLVLEVCSAIQGVLMPRLLQWPDKVRLKSIKDEFESMSGIQNVGGAMYTTHVPIIAPKINQAAYFNKRHTERNQKPSYSIALQGVVDNRGIFTDVCIGCPGSMPDDQVLEKSALFQMGGMGLLKDVWIVGDSGHPLMDWILVPYTYQNRTWTQDTFNEKVGEIQRVAKEAFARLKGRWSYLQKSTGVKLQELSVVLGACCVLHNICEMRNEEMDPQLRFELFDDKMVAENSVRSMTSMQARDHIAHNLLHH